MSQHNGCCSFCGSQVKDGFVTCTGCGATWTPTVGLLGQFLFGIAIPVGIVAALAIGFQTRSPGLGIVALFVAGLGTMFVALSAPLRTWLWVQR